MHVIKTTLESQREQSQGIDLKRLRNKKTYTGLTEALGRVSRGPGQGQQRPWAGAAEALGSITLGLADQSPRYENKEQE